MIYIIIPEGMEYQRVSTQNEKGETIKEDCFVSLEDSNHKISIQKAVHEFYHDFYRKS